MPDSAQLISPYQFLSSFVKVKKFAQSIWHLKRMNLFEFCDQKWLKGAWREAYLDGLNTTFKMFKLHADLAKPFNLWISKSNKKNVLELCSGGGGPINTLIEKSDEKFIITLSDLNPDVNAFEKVKEKYPDRISFINKSTDATDTKGLETNLIFMCSSFHHFSPQMAQKILLNAYKNSNGIFIQEILSRNFFNMISSIFNLLPLMLTPFFSGRLTFFKVLITTIIPIIPLMIIFDGIVSVLRTYTIEEIFNMMPEKMKKEWQWTAGYSTVCGVLKAPFLNGIKI